MTMYVYVFIILDIYFKIQFMASLETVFSLVFYLKYILEQSLFIYDVSAQSLYQNYEIFKRLHILFCFIPSTLRHHVGSPGSLLLYPVNVAPMFDSDVCASNVVLTRRHFRDSMFESWE